mgnify:CR=1 FL=1
MIALWVGRERRGEGLIQSEQLYLYGMDKSRDN